MKDGGEMLEGRLQARGKRAGDRKRKERRGGRSGMKDDVRAKGREQRRRCQRARGKEAG